MKRKDLLEELNKTGWSLFHGSNHDQAENPDYPGIKIAIPRHKEINEYTARSILNSAGIKNNSRIPK
ncbi:hypothetical protein FACS1894219_01620 [Clostridia bacterium]|nr:hypothetical protein FACS1894219_01620 [Clostridia bacterium]